MIYLLAQAIYFRVETGTGWRPRVIGAVLLGIGAAGAYWLPPYAVVASLVIMLLALAIHLAKDAPDNTVTATLTNPTRRSPPRAWPVARTPGPDHGGNVARSQR